jgi:hypothetical protein
MNNINATAFFCQDIREEVHGTKSIIGILPNNIGVPEIRGMIPKMGIYFQIHVPIRDDIRKLTTIIRFSDKSDLQLSEVSAELIAEAKQEALSNELPFIGFISTVLISPFEIKETGSILALVNFNDEEYVCGILNVKLTPAATPTT